MVQGANMNNRNKSYLKTFKRSLTAVAISTVIGMSSASAEDIKGTVSVLDGSNAGITVVAKNTATGSTRSMEVNSDGSYRLPKLPTGSYEVIVSKGSNILAQSKVRIGLGQNTVANFDVNLPSSNVEVIEVTAARVSAVDVSSMDSGLVLSEADLDRMPIARNLTSVALLAPGVVLGDTKFAGAGPGFASFGGSSVAENSCYINGLEVTNTRQGLGCGSVPFEFYNEFQVKTGGYSAKFGRATGGVINSNTKSGTNDWEFAATATFQPDSLQDEGSVSRANGGTGKIFRDTRFDTDSSMEYTISASGPIIEDKLYIYALVNPRDTSTHYTDFNGRDQNSGVTEFRKRESSGSDNMFWGGKIDWDINEDHRLSYFTYSNENTAVEQIYTFDSETAAIGTTPIDSVNRKRGGTAQSLSYTGHFTDNFNVTAMAGRIETEYTTNVSNVDCPSVVDTRTNGTAQGCGSGGQVGENFDENTQYRLDLEYTFGDHTVTAGYDYQKRESTNRIDRMAGDHAWTYGTVAASANLSTDGIDYTNTTGTAQDFVSDRIFIGGGDFYSDLSAIYIEDEWQVTDNLLVSIGVRRDEFDSYAVGGGLLTSFKTDLAPRLGFSWDVEGDGESKVYATWGHYYLPVANNTIYRVGSGISDTTAFYTFDGIDPTTGSPLNPTPITGDIVSSTAVNSAAIAPAKEVFQAEEADPFAKEELIIGYDQVINENYTLSLRGTYRTIETALDDYCGKYSYPHCVMLNPGEASSWYKDGLYWTGSAWGDNGGNTSDGQPDPGSFRTHTVEEIGLPEAENKYTALQATVNYNNDNMRWNFIYTWSRSTGNFEGAVKSDIGQADAGLTQDFDFAALMDGASGYQANDRRHVFKFFGSYDVTDDLTLGLNASLASGRPLSIYGKGHPSNDPNLFGGWGDFFYTYNGCTLTPDANGEDECLNENKDYTYNPRGTAGRTSWTFNVDMSASYRFEVSGIDMRASLDVFNVLNNQASTSQNEHYEVGSEGTQNQWYDASYSWQAPRYVRLGFEARF